MLFYWLVHAPIQMMMNFCRFFFFNDTATTEIYTLSLHDALPISHVIRPAVGVLQLMRREADGERAARSEEHTSELQSPCNLVCRLLLEKKNSPEVLPLILLAPKQSAYQLDRQLLDGPDLQGYTRF